MQEYVDFIGKQSPYSNLDGDDLTREGLTVKDLPSLSHNRPRARGRR
jgi:hypothetical protein